MLEDEEKRQRKDHCLSWLLLDMTPSKIGGARREVFCFQNAPYSAQGEAAASDVNPNQPGGEDISEVMEEVGVGNAVHCRIDRY